METQVAESEFNQVWGKSDLGTAVMIFQDKTPEAIREKFDTHQWIVALKSASSESKIKKEAWQNIKTAKLTFAKAGEFFVDSFDNKRLKLLMLNVMCLSARTPHDINYCIGVLDDNDGRMPNLLERLSKADGLFTDWTAVFLNSKNTDVRKEAFSKAEKTEATFEEWETFDKECRRFFRESYCRSYLSQRFAEMRKRADTFRKKLAIYNAFNEEKSLIAEILKDMENTAEESSGLVWVYKRTNSESVKKKILTAQGSFQNWLNINQCADEDWLKELSLKRMKESAETFDQKATIWCRDPSEPGKKTACFNMIRMAENLAEAKLACHRAFGTSLETKARQKLKKIVLA